MKDKKKIVEKIMKFCPYNGLRLNKEFANEALEEWMNKEDLWKNH